MIFKAWVFQSKLAPIVDLPKFSSKRPFFPFTISTNTGTGASIKTTTTETTEVLSGGAGGTTITKTTTTREVSGIGGKGGLFYL